MAYSTRLVQNIRSLTLTPGVKLGRWAVHLDVPISTITKATGATRQTVYNWFRGGPIAVYYQEPVSRLLKCLVSSKTADEAWSKICTEFSLKP